MFMNTDHVRQGVKQYTSTVLVCQGYGLTISTMYYAVISDIDTVKSSLTACVC